MGNEALCRVEIGSETSEAKTLLETEEIVIRSPFRVTIPFREMKKIDADGDTLRFIWKSQPVSIALGGQARKWAEKIRNPKTRVEKIGVKKGQKVSLIGDVEAAFRKELTERGADVSDRVRKGSDVIFYAASERDDLDRLSALKESLVPDGAIWVLRPKGTKSINDADVIAAGKRAGLVDVKVVRFSETHTAEKLVIPVTKR